MNTKNAFPNFLLTPIAYAVALALFSLSHGSASAQAGPKLPAGAQIVQGANAPVVSQQGTQQTMRIDQTAPRAIINWNSFNIGAGNRVEFNQRGQTDWTALNRVVGTERSLINGVLQADGQVYLLNNNGILIGKGAQINVHTFLASTLGMTDKVFNDGLLSPGNNAPTLIAGTGAFSPKGNIKIEPDAIVVAKDGGRISFIASGQVYDGEGRLLLDANSKPVLGSVENHGQLFASNGQIILAAGDKVYFRNPDPDQLLPNGKRNVAEQGFAGLVVEVDEGGKVANALSGFIQSKLGNISMVAFAVNQDGRVSATTSVNRNGSIWLMARDNTNGASQTSQRTPTRGGELALGAGSLTDIFPDQDKTGQTTGDASNFARSQVRLEGKTIHLQGTSTQGARIVAPSASVEISARTDPSVQPTVADDAAIVLDNNTRIDVSGLQGNVDADGNLTTAGISVPVERNSIRIELRGEQLADAPILRDSPIVSQPIYIDARIGTSLINQSTVTDAISAGLQRGIFERLGTGGRVELNSSGTVALLPGSNVSIRGGLLAYTEGVVKTSRLFDGRRFYGVASAPNDRRYISISDVQARLEKPSTVGLSAGTFSVASRNLLLEGTVLGGATVGTFQHASAPYRGGFTVNAFDIANKDFGLQHAMLLSESSSNDNLGTFMSKDTSTWSRLFDAQFGSGLITRPQNISPQMLVQSEVASISLSSNGAVGLAPGSMLKLKPGTGLELRSAQGVSIDAGIQSAAGKLSFGGEVAGVSVGTNVTLDVGGLWINESGNQNKPIRAELDAANKVSSLYTNGGSVVFGIAADATAADKNLSPARFAAGSTVDTSAGVFINAAGKVSGGKGGNLVTLGDPSAVLSVLPTNLIGYGFTGGSTLQLTSPTSYWFGANAPSLSQSISLDQVLSAGYSTLGLIARGDITFASGYQFGSTLTQYTLPNGRFREQGSDLRNRAQLVQLDASLALPVTLGFSARNVQVQPNARVGLPVGGQLSMTGDIGVSVDGNLSAPSGVISLVTNNKNSGFGYRPDAGIRIGNGATLDVAGVAVPTTDGIPANLGQVRGGGTINLSANGDSGTVIFDEQASIAINGTSANFDVAYKQGASTRYRVTQLASDAGALNVTSVQGGLFAGKVLAQGGGLGTKNGTYNFNYVKPGVTNSEIDVPLGVADPLLFPLGEAQFVLTSAALARPQGYSILGDWDVSVNGVRPDSNANSPISVGAFDRRISQWRISESSLQEVGSLNLNGGEVARLDGISNISAKQSIRIGSTVLRTDPGQDISWSAPYIRLGSILTPTPERGNSPNNTPLFVVPPVEPNASQISFNAAKGLDLEADFRVQGANRVNLNSPESIRLVGGRIVDGFGQGSFTVPGDLSLSASTIFPTTRADYKLNAPDGDIKFTRPPNSAPLSFADVPFSALGKLSATANNIDQSGALYAPFGQINLTGEQLIRFAPNSITSVSGLGVQVPLGTITNGVDWLVGTTPLKNPSKSISVSAPTVVVEGGSSGKAATVDASGGGDILAYEFVRGPQGSADLYAAPGSFAVLPIYQASFAPIQAADFSTAIAAGATLRIETGVAGLPAGVYRILPASYAQLEGAFLVRPSIAVGLGSPIVSNQVRESRAGINSLIGYRAQETLGASSQKPEWFDVLSSVQVRTLAEYRSNTASSFFGTETASRVQDAGTVTLAAQKGLALTGTVNLGADAFAPAAAQARRGTLEITGLSDSTGTAGTLGNNVNIRIAALDTPVANQNGTLVVRQAKLDEIAAGDVHIGATLNAAGDLLSTQANSVSVESGVTLKAGTVVLSANNAIIVEAGAKVEAAGSSARNTTAEFRALDVSRASAATDSSGATVIASSQSTLLSRRGTIATEGPQIQVGAQSLVRGTSVVVDTTGALAIDNSAQVLGGKDTKIGTQTVVIGQAPGSTPGFVLSGNLLNALNQTASISLQGYQKIEAYGSQALGGALTNQLRLDTPALVAGAPNASLNLTAGKIEWLRSSLGANAAPVGSLAGTRLTMNTTGNSAADGLRIGAGDKSINGFANVDLNVGTAPQGSRLNFEGIGSLNIDGNLNVKVDQIQTSLIGGQKPLLADVAVNVVGTATFARSTGQTPSAGSEGAGGKLGVTADSISFNSAVKMPSGEITLTSNSGNLTLGAQADLNVAGYQRPIYDRRIELSGGKVSLNASSTAATLTIADGAKVDVSAGNNTAGTLEIRSAGTLDLGNASVIQGSSSLAHRGGALLVDARQGVDLDRVAKLSVEGQFNRSLDVRARTGDLTLSQASSINTESVVVAADQGRLDVAGSINANSASGGKVELWQGGTGNQVLTLKDSAKINVAGETGGEITIGSTNAIVVAGKPSIVGGSTDGRRAATFTLRAPRTGAGSGSGIAVSSSAAGDAIAVSGKVNTSIEGVGSLTFANTLALAGGGGIKADVAAYQANAQAIIASVPLQTTGPTKVLAGIDIKGDVGANLVTSTTTLDFAASNIGLGALTVRSQGNLTLAGSVSDGLTGAAAGRSGATTLERDSWSYRLVAGADVSAANPLAVLKNSTLASDRTGNLTIAPNKDVRTGTGSIALAAAEQINFSATPASQPGSVYTVGRLAGPNEGYVIEPGYFASTGQARTQGGSITVQAGGLVKGNDMQVSPSSWFLRQGRLDTVTGDYSVVSGYMPTVGVLDGTTGFNMHLGSLAGGKLTVNALGAENLYLANVSSGRMRSTTPDPTKFEIINRAPTTVTVAKNIAGGQYMTMDGELSLVAGQSIQANTVAGTVPILFHGNTPINVSARSGLTVSQPYNPTMLVTAVAAATNNGFPTFSTFGDKSVLNASSVNELSVQVPTGSQTNTVSSPTGGESVTAAARLTTPNWMIQSATNIRVGLASGGQYLAPSDDRKFSVLAADNVWSQTNGLSSLSSSSANRSVPSILNPIARAALPGSAVIGEARILPELIGKEREPIRIYAGSGDVAPSLTNTQPVPPINPTIQFNFGQSVWVKAGRDVSQLELIAQNGKDSDETSVQAGRDIVANRIIEGLPNTVNGVSTPTLVNNDARIEVNGPGTAVLMAGRDIRFGSVSNRSVAFGSVGNAKVADLPASGASLVLIAGLKEQPAYDALLNTYLKPSDTGVSFDQSRHVALARESLIKAGRSPEANASPQTIWSAVQGLAKPQREQLARNIFFQELKLAGGPDTTGIIRDHIAPVQGGDQPVRFATDLVTFLASKGDKAATLENAWSKFQSLPIVFQAEFVSSVALPKLLSDRVVLSSSPLVRDYARGYKASALLFPQDGSGNIELVYNTVRSNQGGAIQLIAPGIVCRDADPASCSTPESAFKADPLYGNIRVGLTNPPAAIATEASLGIVGLGGANVQAFVGNDISVNQSRIVAGGGGDLLLWSAGGGIDAGRGSKAAISVPPPVIKINELGNVTVDLSNAIQGSGIRALSFDEKTPAGGVSLYAPKGTINAGDAGIVGGNVTVGARIILNAENIRTSANQDVSPSTALAPAGLSSSASSSSTTDAATKAVAAGTADTSKRVRIIVIDFEGFGVDCKEAPQDPTCRKTLSSVSAPNQ
jgi:filamentous hemagglutinin